MKTKRPLLQWLARFVAVVVLLCLVILAVAVLLSKRDLDKYRAELEARGESFDVAALAPPPLPQDMRVMDAIRNLDASRHSYFPIHRWSSGHTNTLSTPAHLLTTPVTSGTAKSWQDVETALASTQPHLNTIRELSREPDLFWDVPYSADFPQTHEDDLGALFSTPHTFLIDTVVRLHHGDVAGAIDNTESLLLLQRLTAEPPMLPCQGFLHSCILNAQICTWEIIQSPNTTPAQLEFLQRCWEQSPDPTNLAETIRMERAMTQKVLSNGVDAYYILTWRPFQPPPATTTTTWGRALLRAIMGAWQIVFRYADEKEIMQLSQVLLDQALPEKGHPFNDGLRIVSMEETSLGGAWLSRFFSKLHLNDLRSLLINNGRAAAWRRVTITALAIRRYELDNFGAPPPTLEALIPTYLAKVPDDPFDGHPLRYKPEADGFVLYSIGLNGFDDGGDLSSHVNSRKDLVWPRPAKPAPATP